MHQKQEPTLGDLLHSVNQLSQQIEDVAKTQLELQALMSADEESDRQWYSPAEVAALLGRSPYTVREWCRLQRINARKRRVGRGDADEWEISRDEVDRYKDHGLLPMLSKY